MSTFFLIPDGLRRNAKKKNQKDLVNYIKGAHLMFKFCEQLFSEMKQVGLFPLAKYNLARNSKEVEAALEGIYRGFQCYLEGPGQNRKIAVIGDLSYLGKIDSRFNTLFENCIVNPHLKEQFNIELVEVFIYMCYDWELHFSELYKTFPEQPITSKTPVWTYAFRTGCKRNMFRYSGIFPGTAQTYSKCTEKLFQEITYKDLVSWI